MIVFSGSGKSPSLFREAAPYLLSRTKHLKEGTGGRFSIRAVQVVSDTERLSKSQRLAPCVIEWVEERREQCGGWRFHTRFRPLV